MIENVILYQLILCHNLKIYKNNIFKEYYYVLKKQFVTAY